MAQCAGAPAPYIGVARLETGDVVKPPPTTAAVLQDYAARSRPRQGRAHGRIPSPRDVSVCAGQRPARQRGEASRASTWPSHHRGLRRMIRRTSAQLRTEHRGHSTTCRTRSGRGERTWRRSDDGSDRRCKFAFLTEPHPLNLWDSGSNLRAVRAVLCIAAAPDVRSAFLHARDANGASRPSCGSR